MARQLSRSQLPVVLLLALVAAFVVPCFVAPPRDNSALARLVPVAIGVASNPIQAAYAKLPPLEDVPLEEIGATRQGKLEGESDTFFGISFQVWIFVILGAVSW
ncbi:unnamed protein product, partial [Effrenium voratum]